MKNEQGEINANLTLNIQVAPEDQVETVERKESVTTKKTSTTTTETKEQVSVTSMSTKRKKSVILQCNVIGDTDVKIDWSKDGQEIQTTEQSRESRYSIERKASETKQHETVVQLEIMEASLGDKGSYELVATSTEGEKTAQTLVLTEETIAASLAAQPDEVDTVKKKKKKIVKKKKKKEEKKEIKKPELSSYLRSMVKLHTKNCYNKS